MKTIPIDEATEEELRTFALDTLGIGIKATAKLETVRARVRQAWDKPEIRVDDSEPLSKEVPSKASPQPVTDAQQAPAEGMVRLILGVTEDAGGADDVQVGVNGKIMLVPRGKEVEIPEPYFESLAHAVTHKYDALPDGGMNPIPRKVPLYPFQVLVSTPFTERLQREAA
jgi:hypothetical protein